MAEITYSEKLHDPRWQKKRLLIFDRDDFTCTQCGNQRKELALHHKVYIPGIEPWDYPDDILITICKDCHDKEFVRWKYESYLLHSLKATGFTAFEILALSSYLEKYNGIRVQLKNIILSAVNDGL